MESTLLESFLRASKLKCWLVKPDFPPVIKECKELFDKVYTPEIPNDDDGDTVEVTTMPIHSAPADLCVLLKDEKGVVMRARM